MCPLAVIDESRGTELTIVAEGRVTVAGSRDLVPVVVVVMVRSRTVNTHCKIS